MQKGMTLTHTVSRVQFMEQGTHWLVHELSGDLQSLRGECCRKDADLYLKLCGAQQITSSRHYDMQSYPAYATVV